MVDQIMDTVEELQKAVEQLHTCRARFIETAEVVEVFQGKMVWEGKIFIFNLEGHPRATTAYAWSSPIEGSTKRRFYTVLNIPPVDSPQKAVRASIVNDFKKNA